MWDYLTGLYFYNARYYDPEMGRFTQADTIVPRPLDPQTFNRYSYVTNNPLKYTDPSGHLGIAALFFMMVLNAVVSQVVTAAIIGIASYMIAGALMSAITGKNYISGEGIGGAALGSILNLIPGVGEIMLAIGLVQFAIACHNGQGGEAMLGLVCGLVGGYIANKFGRFTKCVPDNLPHKPDDQIERESIPIEGTIWEENYRHAVKEVQRLADLTPSTWDHQIIDFALSKAPRVYVYLGDPKDMSGSAWYNPRTNSLYFNAVSITEPFTVFHEFCHIYQMGHLNDPLSFSYLLASREGFAEYGERRFRAESQYYHFDPQRRQSYGYQQIYRDSLIRARNGAGHLGYSAFRHYFPNEYYPESFLSKIAPEKYVPLFCGRMGWVFNAHILPQKGGHCYGKRRQSV